VITGPLVHPELLEALASSGHGSGILIADGNYPYLTATAPGARVIHLNLRPGLLDVTTVLEAVLTTVNIEAATLMQTPPDVHAPAQEEYARMLGPDVPIERVERFAFYDRVRSPDTGVVVATGDERLYGNLLLTIGLR
jgi:L-fucose mutarotase